MTGLLSWRQALRFRAPGGRRPRRRAALRPEVLEARALLTTYTLPLVNRTLLDPSQYSIYVGGFSQASGLSVQPGPTAGVLTLAAQTGTVSTYQLGPDAGEYSSIQFDSSQVITGARVYFFVVPAGQEAPSFTFGAQPANPPDYPYLYEYVELTQPGEGSRPTVDVSTVDGFSFPVTLTLNDNLGEVGQPLRPLSGNRPAIIAAYGPFMSAPGRSAYQALQLPASSKAAGQSGGLLNPYAYLTATTGINPLPVNVNSPLNTVFDAALNTLFGRSGWSLQGSDSNTYTARAGTYAYANRTNPITNRPVKLPGIRLTGGGNTFTVFNPTRVNVLTGTDGQAITATSVPGQLNQVVLSHAPAARAIRRGMYVFGTYFDQNSGQATNYVTGITRQAGRTIVTLKNPLPFAVSQDQVVFSHLPDLAIMEQTSGSMVFGGAGFFADAAQQGITGTAAKTLGNLEEQINAALNRGVAVVPSTRKTPGPLSRSRTGYATQFWGTETNWYPAGQPQNLFSLFLHTATVDGDPIFVRPPNPAKTKGGAPMSAAYGFAYDENPGPVPPAPANQPNVPSKFDPVPDGTTTITITLGPWFSIA